MEYNVNQIDVSYDFTINGISYIGSPKANTAMYVSKKVAHLLENVRTIQNCLVFAEEGMEVDTQLRKNNCIIFSKNPQRSYAEFANDFARQKCELEKGRKYTLTKDGYYLGENVRIGEGAYIEPMVLIGHDVIIGNNASISAGSIIKNAAIGDDFVCNEHAVIGSPSFTMYEDEERNKYRIPSLGKVVIGNHVEIGACNNIAAGGCSDTIIEDYVKLDALVHIGHEVHIHKNAELTAGVIVAGFVDIGERSYFGVNSVIRNRAVIGADSFIGMGAVVVKDVAPGITVAGNPAKVFERVK